MATGAAAEMMLRCVLEGSLVMQELEVERRPYHRNCSCALHNLKSTVCSSAACSRTRNISFSKKKTWNIDSSLTMASTTQFSSQSSLQGGHTVRGNESNTSREFCQLDGQNISQLWYCSGYMLIRRYRSTWVFFFLLPVWAPFPSI